MGKFYRKESSEVKLKMGKMNKEEFKLLKQCKYRLTKQQYKTLKGQIIANDINGFRKGLFTILKRKYV